MTSVFRTENVSNETNKTLTQNPPQTYRCESLHPNALKKKPNINHLNAQNPTQQPTKRESMLIKVWAINYPEWNMT